MSSQKSYIIQLLVILVEQTLISRKKISRAGDILTRTTVSRINDYEERFSKVSKWYDSLLKDILVDRYDTFEAYRAAKELFYKDKLNFVAIDCTEYSKQMFDMIVFFAGAYSSEGSIDFSGNEMTTYYKTTGNRFE